MGLKRFVMYREGIGTHLASLPSHLMKTEVKD